jgi:adenylate cyclase
LVAEAMERSSAAGEVSQLLAQHFDAAGEVARALPAYAAAARQAGQRYATSNAIALCVRALDMVPRLPEGRVRDELELELLGTLCRQFSSSTFHTAFAGRDPLQVHTRAIEIARRLGDVAALYGALTRMCNYNMVLARYAQSNTFASELEQLEQQHELEPSVLHSGIFARAYIAFFRADFPTALRLFESLVPPESEPSVFHGNQPGRVLALGHLACVRWVAGDSERALSEAQATLQLANELGVPIFQALGHVVLGRLRYLRRDPLGVVELEAQQALGTTSVDLGLFTEAGAFSLWARAQRAPLPLSAIEPMLEGLQQRLQEVSTCATLLAQVLIDVLRVSGHAVRARDLTEKIISFAVEQGELVYLPELLRLRGEQLESTDATAAARDYQEAIALARATGARSLEQRAGESLARLGHGS